MAKTDVNGSALEIPVYEQTNKTFQPTKLSVDNTLLAQLFEPEELESLAIVKIPSDAEASTLKT